jgi:hypothetical protein
MMLSAVPPQADFVCGTRHNFPKKGMVPEQAHSLVLFLLCRLSTKTKLLNDSSVSLNVILLEVIKNTTSLTNELKQ